MITRRDEQKKSIREYMRGGREYVKQTALSRELPGHARLFSVLTLIPGASIGGCGRVQDDDQFYDVNAGDSMATFSGHGHAVENTGDHDLVILAVIVSD